MFRANDVVAETVGMAIAERYFGLALNQGAGGPIAVLCIKPLVVGVAPVMISRRIGDAELSLLRGNENLTLTVVYEGALKLSEQTISDAFETIRTPRRFSLR